MQCCYSCFRKLGSVKVSNTSPLLCVLSALHRWIAVEAADLLSKIRNGGGNGSELSQSGNIQGALEGHRVWPCVKDG